MTAIADRLARCIPGATFELEALARLAGIEETTDVPTAAVTCRGRARMLVNPDFVAEHCVREEHLFLLVMHELWHVLLGHTTLYARLTPAHNIAFDAIINAGLARQHPGPAYRGFFEALNPADAFPGLLLRPPLGWPDAPEYDVPGPRGTAAVLARLYPHRRDGAVEPTYDELLQLLRDADVETGFDRSTLLGDHGDAEGSPLDDPLFGDIVRRIVAGWPPPPFPLRGRDAGRDIRHHWTGAEPSDASLRRSFATALARVLGPDLAGARRPERRHEVAIGGPGPLPNAADRLLPAKRALGAAAMPAQLIDIARRQPETASRAIVYLDVSGSMADLLPRLIDMIVPFVRRRMVAVRQFSTVVEALSLDDLARGRLTTTDGTDIDCVLVDLAARPQRRAMLVTDGYVGRPTPGLVDELRGRGLRLEAVLPADGWDADLTGIARITRLPDLGP